MDNHSQADEAQRYVVLNVDHTPLEGGVGDEDWDDEYFEQLTIFATLNVTGDSEVDFDEQGRRRPRDYPTWAPYTMGRRTYHELVFETHIPSVGSDQWQSERGALMPFQRAFSVGWPDGHIPITDAQRARWSQLRSQAQTLRSALHRGAAATALDTVFSQPGTRGREGAILGYPPDYRPRDGREPRWDREDLLLCLLYNYLGRLLTVVSEQDNAAAARERALQLSPEERACLQEKLALHIQTQDETCPICYEALHSPVITRCGHVFGESCLSLWMQSHQSCPTCRQHVHGERSVIHPAIAADTPNNSGIQG